jgi:hypothetical protein
MDAHDDISKAQKLRNFLIMLSTMAMPCSQPMNEETRQKILFLRSITKVYHQCKHIMNFFFSSYFFRKRKERRKDKDKTNFLLHIDS